MFRKMFVALALLCASTAFAAQTTIDVSGLTEAQVAELKAQAAKAVSEQAKDVANGGDPKKVLATAATWGTQAATAAEGFAKALGIAAKELNVTINDFLKSDAGKLTAMLIIWKVAGAAIMHALYGFIYLAIGLIMLRVMYTRLFTDRYEVVQYSRLWGMWSGTHAVRIPKSFGQMKADGEWLAFWVMIALMLIVLLGGAVFF